MLKQTDVDADRRDEQQAVRTYGQRQRQTTGRAKAHYREMQADEKDHARRLGKIRSMTRGR